MPYHFPVDRWRVVKKVLQKIPTCECPRCGQDEMVEIGVTYSCLSCTHIIDMESDLKPINPNNPQKTH